jgi:hypothetical protein
VAESRNPWKREQESRPCRRAACAAKAGEHCVTINGISTQPHAERTNDAHAASGEPFYPLQEGHWVSGQGPFPKRGPLEEIPPEAYDATVVARLLRHRAVDDAGGELTSGTGRPGVGYWVLLGAFMVRHAYGLHGWARTVRLIAAHDGLRDLLGEVPSQSACYRFGRRLAMCPEIRDSLLKIIAEDARDHN